MSIVIKQKLLLLFILFSLLSCKTNNNEVEMYKIISMLIDEYAIPVYPPPPLINGLKLDKEADSSDLKKHNNLEEKNLIVHLRYPSSVIKGDNIKINDSDTYRIDEISKSSDLNSIINPLKLNVKENIRFYNKEGSQSYNFNEIDMIISFSKIKFNSTFDEAILIIGVSRGKLNGFSSIINCKKNNGKWKVTESKLLSVS